MAVQDLSFGKDVDYREAADFLNANDGFCVVSHAHPDGDTLGSAAALVLALRKMGKSAFALCADEIPRKLAFFNEANVFESVESISKAQTFVSVDVASKPMLGALDFLVEGRKFALSVDHHEVNSIPCEKRLLRANYIANGEIVYELLKELGVPLDKQIATALYGAICSDSGGFKYPATRPETYEYAAELIRAGADFDFINKQLFECKSMEQVALEKSAYEALEFHYGGRFAMVAVSAETMKACGAKESDIDVLNQIPRQVEGVEVSAVLRPKGEEIKVSLRSNADINVAEFAKAHGGGGHYHAAGYRLCCTLDEAKARIIEDVKSVFS